MNVPYNGLKLLGFNFKLLRYLRRARHDGVGIKFLWVQLRTKHSPSTRHVDFQLGWSSRLVELPGYGGNGGNFEEISTSCPE